MGRNYYENNMNSQKLFQVYQTQLPRIIQYLNAEISFVQKYLTGSENVLELGAGYGRILKEIAPYCKSVVGIDISTDNVALGKDYLSGVPNVQLEVMDVHHLYFQETFDVILCLQNGLSAMRLDPILFVHEMLSLTTKNGRIFFSTYSAQFWKNRLAWFQEQANKNLLGEIDLEKTRAGKIICKDGFQAITHSQNDFELMGKASGYPYEIVEVDQSSLFLVIYKNDHQKASLPNQIEKKGDTIC